LSYLGPIPARVTAFFLAVLKCAAYACSPADGWSNPMALITTGVTPAQIRAARGLLNWSQTELARRAQTARKTIVEYEGGKRRLMPRTAAAIVQAFVADGIVFDVNDGVRRQP
jgi:DNA-binding XRE family transcriptional regulator